MAIDWETEPPEIGRKKYDLHSDEWYAWQDLQGGGCECHKRDPNLSPFQDEHLADCGMPDFEAEYREHKAKAEDALKATLGVLVSYLTPLTAVHDLAIPSPAYIRSDGETVLPEGKLSALHGMPSIGKSFVALDMARGLPSAAAAWSGGTSKTPPRPCAVVVTPLASLRG